MNILLKLVPFVSHFRRFKNGRDGTRPNEFLDRNLEIFLSPEAARVGHANDREHFRSIEQNAGNIEQN